MAAGGFGTLMLEPFTLSLPEGLDKSVSLLFNLLLVYGLLALPR